MHDRGWISTFRIQRGRKEWLECFVHTHFAANAITEAKAQELAPRLSDKWNSSASSYSFLYAHTQSSMEYVIKVDRLGGKAEIRGIGLGDERISRFEITAKDYISNSALPLRITLTADGEEDRSDLETKLKEIFISSSRIQGQSPLYLLHRKS